MESLQTLLCLMDFTSFATMTWPFRLGFRLGNGAAFAVVNAAAIPSGGQDNLSPKLL